jgi:chemotaxis protein CheX
MKAKFINPFLKASVRLFKEYIGINVLNGQPYINDNPQDLYEVSAIIGLAGQTQGAIVLSFSRETAIKMVSLFAGVEYKALTAIVIDGVGEMVNILAGNAKRDLSDYRIDISLPGIITGNQYKINWPKDVPVVSIPFQTHIGNFMICVSLKDGE